MTFEAAAMYVCANSYRRTARERLPAGVLDVAGEEPARRGGVLIAEFNQPAPAGLLRDLLAAAAAGAVWVEAGGHGVRRRLVHYRVLTTAAQRSRMLAGLREAWRAGVGLVNDERPAGGQELIVERATQLWRGLLAAGAPVRSARGLCLPLPAGPLAEVAVNGARHLGISARVRHTTQFSVVTVDNQVQVLWLTRLMPYRQGRATADGKGTP
ncbi:hypothetical protein AB0H83_41860 [Dactylosporangium sp. NPDC050688]|uniref:hypothetical protein n=1 Tax=Dactylosporangium sp. NPDC050688 TaxID=3157217 RepID=UPI0033D7D008